MLELTTGQSKDNLKGGDKAYWKVIDFPTAIFWHSTAAFVFLNLLGQ